MDAFKVDLFALKNEGGSASATIDLGRRRPFLAWGSVSMVDPLTDFDRPTPSTSSPSTAT